MPILAAIPAVVGAGMAVADAVDGPTDETQNLGQHSEASKSAFYSPMGKDKWGGLSGIHGDWQGVGKVATPDRQGVYSARGQRYGSRTQEGQGLDLLKQYATGEKSAARLAAADAVARSQQSMAAQAAGGSPAAQRAAMYGTAAAGQNIAGRAASLAAQEQLGAQKSYMGALGARRQRDIMSQLAEQQWFQQQGAFGLGANAQYQSGLGMGMSQANAERNARMGYEKMLRGQSMDQQRLNEQKRQTNVGAIKDTGVGIMNAVSSVASKPGSDRSVKRGVSTPTPQEVFGRNPSAAAAAGVRAAVRPDPYADLYSVENFDVFSDNPYNQDWDREAVQAMQDREYRARREQELGAAQAQANASAAQVPEDQLYSPAQMADVPTPSSSYERVPTMQALNSLQGFTDKPIPGTWGNSTLNSIQQLVGSDERVKQGARGLSDEELSDEVARRNQGDPVGALLDSLEAKKYSYKDPDSRGAAPGEQIGVMAQDLEKTPAGAALVTDDGPGATKMVDYAKSGPLAFAALAQLNDRLERLENDRRPDQGGRPYDPIAVSQTPYPAEAVYRSFEPDPVELSVDEPGMVGGMTPQGGPGVIQRAVGDFRRAADTSAMRVGSDERVKKDLRRARADADFWKQVAEQPGQRTGRFDFPPRRARPGAAADVVGQDYKWPLPRVEPAPGTAVIMDDAGQVVGGHYQPPSPTARPLADADQRVKLPPRSRRRGAPEDVVGKDYPAPGWAVAIRDIVERYPWLLPQGRK